MDILMLSDHMPEDGRTWDHSFRLSTTLNNLPPMSLDQRFLALREAVD